MRRIDVFNGDADGLCSLRQIRLAEPAESQLVTGTKRDIALLARVEAGAGDSVTVLDVSLERNREDLLRLLERGARVRYFDHHFPGPIPSHPALEAVIDPSEGTCTSALVDRYLQGRHRVWAVVGAFGDNLEATAFELAAGLKFGESELAALRELGRSLNYNAYGESESDLLVPPETLYRALSHYDEPLSFISDSEFPRRLEVARRADLDAALALHPRWSRNGASLHILPDAPWSRRVHGAFANHLASVHPNRAQAVLAPVAGESYVVSVRVPAAAARGADEFCRQFPNGGGRRIAGGIDRLSPERLAEFEERFAEAFG
jgi:hypothetical protein